LVKIISDTPWYIYILCLITGIALSYLLYGKKTDELTLSIRRLLFVLRSVIIALICLLLTNIFLKHIVNRTENPLILLAIDNSQSILSGKDSANYKSQLPEIISELKNKLGARFEINSILFGENTRKSDSISFNDKQTDIGNLFESVANNYSGNNIGAMILLSDGLYNKGIDPVYLTDKLNFPVYTLALGDTSIQKDVWIQKINHNQIAYLGNQFAIEVLVRATRLNNEKIKISLHKNTEKLSEQIIQVNSDNFNSTLVFTAEANAPGIQKYEVKIEPLSTESNTRNNTASFVIEVIDNRDKILLLAHAPHPDIAAVSNAVESMRNYELVKDLYNAQTPNLKGYNLVIFHGYKAEHKAILDACISQNIPYWLINPELTNTGLRELKLLNPIDKSNDSEPALVNTFGLFTLSEELKNLISNLPAVKTPFGKYYPANGSNLFLQQKIGVVNSGDPLMLFNETGDLKSAVFVGDGLWRWRLRNYQESKNTQAFNELISKTIQFLAVKSDKSFFRLYTEKIIFENEAADLTAEVYNKSYELITEPDVTLTLLNNEQKAYSYTFSKTQTQYKLNLGFLQPGEYTYEAKVKVNNELYSKKGVIVVKPVLSEKLNNTANHQLLYNISSNTGGKLFFPAQANTLIETVLSNEAIKPITFSQNETTDLIELKWFFVLLIALLSIEWFIRKYNGLI
jgi:hypothetical protein